MKMSSISGVTCYVKDLDATAEFYEKLGFRFGKREADRLTCYVNWFWVTFVTQDKEEGPDAKKPAHRNNRGSGTYLAIKVENIDEFYKGVLDLGLQPEGEPVEVAKGQREFILRDPDGYNLTFFYKK